MDSPRPLLDSVLAAGDTLEADALYTMAAERLSWIARLDDTPHDPRWHAEGSVGVHTRWVVREAMACAEVRALPPREQWLVIFGALLHDIGKVVTTREAEVDGERRVVSYGHPYAGYSYLAPRMGRLTSDPRWGDRLLALVRFHHHPKRMVSATPVSVGIARQLARVAGLRPLELLERADIRGRTCDDQDWLLEQMTLFRLYGEDLGLYPDACAYVAWSDRIAERFSDPAVQEAILWGTIRDAEADRIQDVEAGIAKHWARSERLVTVHLLAGPPGSGKSTFTRRHLPDIEVISLDALREGSGPGNKRQEGHVRQAALEALRVALRAGRDVVWDATNLQADVRRRLIGIARDYGAFVRLYGFQVDPEALLARNARRARQVPEDVIRRMSERFAFPDFDEADVVHIVDAAGACRVLGDRVVRHPPGSFPVSKAVCDNELKTNPPAPCP